jgi:hypothetical protein
MAPPNNASVIVVFAIVGICIAMAIVKFWTRYECAATRGVIETEGFVDSKNSNITASCPRGSNTYTDPTGAINCCSGTVNGNTCEGTVKCTFSGSLANKYPLCGKGRRRKYTGEINPIVKQIVEAYPPSIQLITTQILPIMNQLKPQLKQLVPSQLSDATYKKYVALIEEEEAWTKDITNDMRNGILTSKEEINMYIEEEIMYIFNSVLGIFQGQPIASNNALIQKQFQSQMCKNL